MDQNTSWLKILESIKEQISGTNFKTWFLQANLESIDETSIIIKVPSAFVKSQLINRYEALIKDSVNKVLGKDLKIDYLIDPSLLNKKSQETDSSGDQEDIFNNYSPINQAPKLILNPKYSLENFVVGLTNNLAYAAAQAVVQNPGISYNPLFIYGPSGVGKTHLMQAIGNAFSAKNPRGKITYASSEKFMNDLVDSIQNKRTYEFRQRYRASDLLLIDDIQFIAGKDSTQQEFFHTFNELHSRNSQIVLTSDRPPHEMAKLESRLVSRFQGGLMVDIQLPDFDTRIAILKAKLQEKNEHLPEDLISLIAESVESNTRELEGKLIQILQNIKMTGQQPTPEFIQRFLEKPQFTNSNPILDHKKVLNGINQYFNVKTVDIIGPRRQKELVLPRQIAMFLMYEECKMPMEKIGDILGGRDHTTVLHGIEKIKAANQRDREIQRIIIELKQQLSN